MSFVTQIKLCEEDYQFQHMKRYNIGWRRGTPHYNNQILQMPEWSENIKTNSKKLNSKVIDAMAAGIGNLNNISTAASTLGLLGSLSPVLGIGAGALGLGYGAYKLYKNFTNKPDEITEYEDVQTPQSSTFMNQIIKRGAAQGGKWLVDRRDDLYDAGRGWMNTTGRSLYNQGRNWATTQGRQLFDQGRNWASTQGKQYLSRGYDKSRNWIANKSGNVLKQAGKWLQKTGQGYVGTKGRSLKQIRKTNVQLKDQLNKKQPGPSKRRPKTRRK